MYHPVAPAGVVVLDSQRKNCVFFRWLLPGILLKTFDSLLPEHREQNLFRIPQGASTLSKNSLKILKSTNWPFPCSGWEKMGFPAVFVQLPTNLGVPMASPFPNIHHEVSPYPVPRS